MKGLRYGRSGRNVVPSNREDEVNGLRRLSDVELVKLVGRAQDMGAVRTVAALWREIRRRRSGQDVAA